MFRLGLECRSHELKSKLDLSTSVHGGIDLQVPAHDRRVIRRGRIDISDPHFSRERIMSQLITADVFSIPLTEPSFLYDIYVVRERVFLDEEPDPVIRIP